MTAGEDRVDCTDRELETVHEVELGCEWLHRAYGAVLEFHHATGHGMEHLERGAELLEEEHPELAAHIRAELLPVGVTPGNEWSYELVEAFEDGPLRDARQVRTETLEAITGGRRHVAEREQQRAWRADRGE